MLRISFVESRARLRLVLEGKLTAPWVAEFRRASSAVRERLYGRRLVIDLHNVTHISQEGESALLELMTEGAKFTCNGVFTKRILEQLTHRCKSAPTVIPLSNGVQSEKVQSEKKEQ